MEREQRTAARHLFHWRAHFGERDMAQVGHTYDISETGAFIKAAPLPKIGCLLRLKFDAPNAVGPVVLGQVVRHSARGKTQRELGFGVKLLSDRTVIRDLIRGGMTPQLGMGRSVVRAEPLRIVSMTEYNTLREDELTRGGLSFTSTVSVPLNSTAHVDVSFLWNGRRVAVSGRVVRCEETAGRFRGILLMEEAKATLSQLDVAAAAR